MKNILEKTEHEFGLYSEPMDKINIVWEFPTIDQIDYAGHAHCALHFGIDSFPLENILNSIIIINLNNKCTEESIINTIIHESLHVAINLCCTNPSIFLFTEKVIDEWMLRKRICYSDCGTKLIVKPIINKRAK